MLIAENEKIHRNIHLEAIRERKKNITHFHTTSVFNLSRNDRFVRSARETQIALFWTEDKQLQLSI